MLFLCPHGAAKSILASAYFQRAAKERGLYVRVEAAGTEPDATVSPKVAEHLQRNGYTIPVSKPRKVTKGDLDRRRGDLAGLRSRRTAGNSAYSPTVG